MAERKPLYATYEDVESEITTQDDSTTITPSKVLQNIAAVSRRVDSLLGSAKGLPWFGPWVGPVDLPLDAHDFSSLGGWWHIRQPLRSLESVARGEDEIDGAYLTAGRIYLPVGSTWNQVVSSCGDTAGPELTINGLWGWQSDILDGLDEVDVLLEDLVNDERTSYLTVDDPELLDPITGAISYTRGRVLKIDDEFMSVITRDSDVQVGRGLFGSTRATHDKDALIYAWSYPDQLVREVARQAAMLYARRGAFQATFVDGIGLTTYPPDLLQSLRATLQDFQ